VGVLDWQKMFVPDTPVLDIIVRGTILYLALFFLLRVVLKRQSGTTSVTDLLVIVLIADAAQNAMADDYSSVTDGLVLVATIVLWAFALDFIAFRFPALRRFIQPQPLALVKDGRMLPRHMHKELITEEELLAQLRQQGVERVEDAKGVYMEGDGSFSVVTGEQHRPTEKKAL
jgi:uncharacterized membrane protein YcaP (DUF421 family)